MRYFIGFLSVVFFMIGGCGSEQSYKNSEGNNMDANGIVDLGKTSIETNSSLWEVKKIGDEQVIRVVNNTEEDNVHGKVALIGGKRKNYSMQVELKFLGNHLEMDGAGWFGVVMRAQDCENYELIWFMPAKVESSRTIAYLSVAHGVVPWWTEAYASQQNFAPKIPRDDWFVVRVDVIDDSVTVYVEDEKVFTKRIAYYLSEGRPGLYVGTATDAVYKNIVIKNLGE